MKALQRAIRHAALDASPTLDDELLRRAGVDEKDIRATDQGRLSVYRALVRNALCGTLAQMLPRTRELLGEDVWDTWVARFLEESPPKTHYLRDVPHELFAFAEPRWRESDVPAYVIDVARHELVLLSISAVRGIEEKTLVDLALDRAVVFSRAALLARYDHAVHEADPPPKRNTMLLVYRDAKHQVRCLELNAVAWVTLERLFTGEALGSAVQAACAASGTTMTEEVITSIAALLADLAERGVVLGA